jgi:hypothetical protein
MRYAQQPPQQADKAGGCFRAFRRASGSALALTERFAASGEERARPMAAAARTRGAGRRP